MHVFNFVVFSLITAPQNVLTPHISITLNVRELELMLKRPAKKKKGAPLLEDLVNRAPSFHRGMCRSIPGQSK